MSVARLVQLFQIAMQDIRKLAEDPQRFSGKLRYYSQYIGYVEDVVDPEKSGRVRVRVPGVDRPETPTGALPWASRVFSDAGDGAGLFTPLQAGRMASDGTHSGDQVLVGFLHGDVQRRFVQGAFYHAPGGEGAVPVQVKNPADGMRRRYVMRTRGGTCVELGDEPEQGELKVSFPGGTRIHAREAQGGKGVHINTPGGAVVSIQDEHPGDTFDSPKVTYDSVSDEQHSLSSAAGADAPADSFATETVRGIPHETKSSPSGVVQSPTGNAATGFGQRGILVKSPDGHVIQLRDKQSTGAMVQTKDGHKIEILDGPNTITMQTSDGNTKITLTQGGGIKIQCPGQTLRIEAGNVQMVQA